MSGEPEDIVEVIDRRLTSFGRRGIVKERTESLALCQFIDGNQPPAFWIRFSQLKFVEQTQPDFKGWWWA